MSNRKRSSTSVRYAIIGAGTSARWHAAAIARHPQARLTAVLDVDEASSRALAEPAGARWGTDPGALLRRDHVDAAVVCTPSSLHAEGARAAVSAGLHVLIEKPLDTSLERADALLAEAASAGVQVGVAFQKRLNPAFGWLKEVVAQGRLGLVTMIEGTVKWYRSPEYFQAAPWRGTWAFDGGGALMNQSIHYADLMLWFGGMPRSLFSHAATLVQAIEAEDTLVATLRFKNGALGVLQATTTACPGLTERFEICGDRGCARIENGRLSFFHEGRPDETIPPYGLDPDAGRDAALQIELPPDPGHEAVLFDFTDALLEGRRPCVDGTEGRCSLELVTSIYESARTGQPVNTGGRQGP